MLPRLSGGLYTKLAQYVASMTHALPPQYPAVLAACQDRAPSVNVREVRLVIERELGCRLEDEFISFEPHALAAASLAQVHRARTTTGEDVAIKVQYPHLERQVAADMRTLHLIAGAMDLFFPDHSFRWLLPEFDASCSAELDFRREAAHAGACTPLSFPYT